MPIPYSEDGREVSFEIPIQVHPESRKSLYDKYANFEILHDV
jgi:hypothetical protein